jgi:3'(2'), 5'-bisphosphate nucleotidase
MSIDSQALLSALCALAAEAGQRILEVYEKDFQVDTKADDSPLTAADRASHHAIVAGLQRLTPEIPVLSEEGALPAFETRRSWPRYWLIDPLDGTREFIKRNGEFTVNIALIEGHKAVIGVVHAPVTGVTWYGAEGRGAFRCSSVGERALHTRRLGEPLVAVVSRSHRGERVDTLLGRLPRHETVSVGSSLKFCLLAEGKADLYPRIGPTSEWDTAAAQCVVEAAGGCVTKVDLSPLRYNTKESLLNPDFLVFGDPSHDWRQHLEGLHGEDR